MINEILNLLPLGVVQGLYKYEYTPLTLDPTDPTGKICDFPKIYSNTPIDEAEALQLLQEQLRASGFTGDEIVLIGLHCKKQR